jgi:hypothetical protein
MEMEIEPEIAYFVLDTLEHPSRDELIALIRSHPKHHAAKIISLGEDSDQAGGDSGLFITKPYP